jgi:hypothetical protein
MKNTLKKLGLTIKDVKDKISLSQNHFGDYLKYEIEVSEDEKYRVWQSHNENVKQGQKRIQIEYFGKSNGFTWKLV